MALKTIKTPTFSHLLFFAGKHSLIQIYYFRYISNHYFWALKTLNMRILLFLATIALVFSNCHKTSEAVKFNDKLVLQHYQIETDIDSLSLAISTTNIVEIEKAHYAVNNSINESLETLKALPSIPSDSIFREGFQLYCKSYEEQLAKFVPTVKKNYNIPKEKYTYLQHAHLESAIYNFNRFRKNNIYQLEIAQENFARKHNLVISNAEKKALPN